MTFEQKIRQGIFVDDIPHFYACSACGFKSHSRDLVIEHQLNDCEQIGYYEDVVGVDGKWS